VFNRPDRSIRRKIMDDLIVGEFTMIPTGSSSTSTTAWSCCRAGSSGAASSPSLVRAVHSVEGLVRAENRLAHDIDDVEPLLRAMVYP
jgi:hypothetical protein